MRALVQYSMHTTHPLDSKFHFFNPTKSSNVNNDINMRPHTPNRSRTLLALRLLLIIIIMRHAHLLLTRKAPGRGPEFDAQAWRAPPV